MSVTLIFLLFPFIRNECEKFPKCQKCSRDETECTQCESFGMSTYIDSDEKSITYGQCILCPKNCKSCGPNGCSSCHDYYGLNENGECVKCEDPECFTCSTNYSYCTKCRYLAADGGKCKNCSDPNCIICREYSFSCGACKIGYKLEKNNCVLVEQSCKTENCQECSEDMETCTECKTFYYLDGNNKCQKCQENCEKCNESHCIKCDTQFGLNDKGECVPCEDPLCAYCYDNYKQCTTCNNMILFKISAKNTCEHHCADNNCQIRQCSDRNTSKCFECNDGYYLSKYGECFPCDVENCKKCPNDKAKCTICKDGYSLRSGNCSKIESPNCADSNCNQCIEGYVLSNGECKKCNDDNCLRCTNDTLSCIECKKGYTFLLEKGSKDHSKCIPCEVENCYSCSIKYDCNVCKQGFILYNEQCVTKKQYLRMEGLISPGDDDNPDDDNKDDDNKDNNNNNEEKNGGKLKLSKNTIIGIAVGCGAAVVIIISIIIYFVVSKKTKVTNASSE